MRNERGIPKMDKESEEIVREILERALELKRETIQKKLNGTTRAKVIPFRKGHLKKFDR